MNSPWRSPGTLFGIRTPSVFLIIVPLAFIGGWDQGGFIFALISGGFWTFVYLWVNNLYHS
jgi:hypothetical protein